MANELTKSVMAAVVQRLSQSAGYEPMKATKFEQGSESGGRPSNSSYRQTKSGSSLGLSSTQENTLKKIIHKDVHLNDQLNDYSTREASPVKHLRTSHEEPNLQQMNKGGVIRLDDLLKAIKK